MEDITLLVKLVTSPSAAATLPVAIEVNGLEWCFGFTASKFLGEGGVIPRQSMHLAL